MIQAFIEAEYEDGFVHQEDEQDRSLYDPARNVYYDIVNRLPEKDHGKMVRFSLINLTDMSRTDVDFCKVPEDAIPVCIKTKSRVYNADTLEPMTDPYITHITFGWTHLCEVEGEDGKVLVTDAEELIELQSSSS